MFRGRMGLVQKLLLGFGFIIILIVFILVYTYMNFEKQTNAVDDNFSSSAIIKEADGVLISLLNMETGSRGYALTGEESFLEPFYKGQADFQIHFTKLKELTSNKPYALSNVEIIKERYKQWAAWETKQILGKRIQVNEGKLTMEEITNAMISKIGKNEMDSIRMVVNNLIKDEQYYLEVRYKTLKKQEQNTAYFMTVGGFFIGIASILISMFTSISISRPVTLLIEATKNIRDQKYKNQLGHVRDKELNVLIECFNEMQEMIIHREEELQIKNDILKSQMAEVNEANKLKSQFLANMSHELRTPLNSIIGFTNRVIKKSGDILPNTQKENLIIVREEAKHLLELINDLLDYSKIEAGKMDVNIERFNLLDVIEEVHQLTQPLAESQKIGYQQISFTDGPIELNSDRMKVKQILINLVSNAFKYSDKGTVTVSVGKKDSRYYIRVRDEGVGIAKSDVKVIFDEFRQVDGTYKRKVGGTGLGLSITKKFVEMLGGEIKLCTTLGIGSIFTIILPEDIEQVQEKTINEKEQINTQYKKRIVCVDDDANIQRLYKQYLNEYGYEIMPLSGKEDVIAEIINYTPDVILLDIMLPNKDGWQILSELKQNKITKNIPVIMISALSERKLAYEMKTDDYLIKPVTQEELLDTILRTMNSQS